MFLPMFLAMAAVFAVFAGLSCKLKKHRILFGVLAVIAFVPAAVLGLIACGAGSIVNYPGDPAAAVEGMVAALERDFAKADAYVMGSLGMDGAEGEGQHLVNMVAESLSVEAGEPVYEEFTAKLPVKLTGLDTEAWLTALEAEALAVLRETVDTTPASQLYNEDRTAYLDGITEQAYQTAFGRMWGSSADYTRTVDVEVTLSWTPMGWKILLDEALISAMEGYALGDGEVRLHDGDMAQRLSARLYNAHADIVENLPVVYKTYTIPLEATAAPAPDPAGFGSTDDPAEVMAVIEKAWDLVGDRKLSWNPDIAVKPGSLINYYYDPSILVIQWKESRNGTLVTYGEVIIRDGSQIRRCISGDSFRNFNWETPTQMSKRTNAVLGMTGDFYMFRGIGVMAYQGQVYRSDPSSMAHLFVTNSGELLMTKSYELSEGQIRGFVKNNDVSFSLAFGPVLVENGEKLELPVYIIGEFNSNYPRAAIGEVDPLHYIVMTVGREGSDDRTVTLAEAQDYIYEKGVQKAYNLDGGRTANMTINGVLTTDPAYAQERTLSDMFYFASAIPEDQR